MRSDMSNSLLSRRDALSSGIASLAALMLSATPVDAAARARAEADPRYRFADRLSDLVIPETSTPGASQANVAFFVLLALDHQMGGMSPVLLSRVQTKLDEAAGQDFMTVPLARAADLLGTLDRAAFAAPAPSSEAAAGAWGHLKAAIVAGYYTSEIGASQELVYEPVPGSFRNIKLTADFRSRSNDGFGGSL